MISQLVSSNNKDSIAIVVVGYNRLASMRRLLNSIESASYDHKDIPLVISVDCSGDSVLYEFVQDFEWSHGPKYVNIQEERLGLKKHIFQCGDLTEYFKAIILLEDDLFVSEYFYQYVEKAVNYYYYEDRIGGISLYQNEMRNDTPCFFMNDGSDTYLKQSPASWGECWTDVQWSSFKSWYNTFEDSMFKDIDMPEYCKRWKNAWSKYYMAYLIQTGRYFVFPVLSHTTCFGDAGEHSFSSSNIGQVTLLTGIPQYYFKSFDEMLRYDIYGTNESIYKWLGLSKENLCVDWYCENSNSRKCRYLLTTAQLPHKIQKSFGLMMRPIELNVKYGIPGKGIYLYDTITGEDNALRVGLPPDMSNYYLRGYNARQALHYVLNYYLNAIKRRFRRK